MANALSGIRVLDFTSVVSGPYGTRLLADCGAEVVKVEPPGGDMLRTVPPRVDDQSRYFAAYNCGKKSIVLDLKNSDDIAMAIRLASACDVLVENYRPGVMARFGLDYDSLRTKNDRMVYASLSGFGQRGVLAKSPAYGPIVQAMSGFEQAHMSYQIGEKAEVPPFVGVQIADIISGTFTFAGIQTALLNRERHGRGDYVDVSLMDSILALTTAELQFAQTGYEPRSTFRPIAVQDGYIMVAAVSPHNQKALSKMMADEGYPPHTGDGPEILWTLANLADWSSGRTAEECCTKLGEQAVPCAPYQSSAEILQNDHLLRRGSFAKIEAEGEPFLINSAPFKFRHGRSEIAGRPPSLGEHQVEIMSTWL